MMETARRVAAVSLYLDKGRGISQDLMAIALKEEQRVEAKEDKVGLGLADVTMSTRRWFGADNCICIRTSWWS